MSLEEIYEKYLNEADRRHGPPKPQTLKGSTAAHAFATFLRSLKFQFRKMYKEITVDVKGDIVSFGVHDDSDQQPSGNDYKIKVLEWRDY